VVVVAAPIEYTFIDFGNCVLNPYTSRSFEHWYVTLVVASGINGSYFGLSPSDVVPDTIFTTPNSSAPFVVLSLEDTAVNGQGIYKTFSNEDLSASINQIYLDVSETYIQAWTFTFPDLTPAPEDYQPIELGNGIYYTSPIESMASAMECSAIAGRNIAKLIHNKYSIPKP